MTFLKSNNLRSLTLLLATFLVGIGQANAERLKDIASIAGQRGNQLIGYGLVVGLDGTGDTSGYYADSNASRSIANLLDSLEVGGRQAGRGSNPAFLDSRNVAAVIVTADLPALSRPGQTLDVSVSSLGSARSLRGGTLLMTPLKAANGQVYAMAQGTLVEASSNSLDPRVYAASSQASGRIPRGAYVEQAAPAEDTADDIEINFRDLEPARMQKAADAIVAEFGPDVVTPIDSKTLQVKAPAEPMKRLNFMARLMELEVADVAGIAKVVVNARTGVVLVNQSVTLAPFAVTRGSLSLRVQGQGSGPSVAVPQSATLQQVVQALNLMGASPPELVSILQAMKAAGALKAELEVI